MVLRALNIIKFLVYQIISDSQLKKNHKRFKTMTFDFTICYLK